MDADKIFEKLEGFLSLEQKFLHQRFKTEAEKLDKDKLIEIIDIVHTNYLIRSKMFKNLVKHCAQQGVVLPPINELWEE
jgi:hypothetical protein